MIGCQVTRINAANFATIKINNSSLPDNENDIGSDVKSSSEHGKYHFRFSIFQVAFPLAIINLAELFYTLAYIYMRYIPWQSGTIQCHHLIILYQPKLIQFVDETADLSHQCPPAICEITVSPYGAVSGCLDPIHAIVQFSISQRHIMYLLARCCRILFGCAQPMKLLQIDFAFSS